MRRLQQILAGVTLAVAALALQPHRGELNAQSNDSLQAVLQRAERSNWTVRVRTENDTANGRITGLRHEAFTVGQRQFAVPDIRELDRRVTDEKPVLMGAVVGGALLGIVGYHACPQGGDYNCGDTPYLLGGMGLAVGTLLGAFVGQRAAESTWEVLWRQQ